MSSNLDLGQHFMKNDVYLQQVLNEFTPRLTDTVIEIGSGQGDLTRKLLQKTNNITCFELDKNLPSPSPDVTFFHANALDQDLNADIVVGNIPYHISEPLLHKLLRSLPREIILVAGKRFSSVLQGQTIIGIYVRNMYDVADIVDIPPSAFSPPPRVVSSLLHLTLKKRHSTLLAGLHARQNQKVKNALMAVSSKTKNTIRHLLEDCSFSDKKMYELSTEEFIRLMDLIEKTSQK